MSKEKKHVIIVLFALSAAGAASCFFVSPAAGIICTATLISVLVVFWMFTANRYKKIAELGDYLRRLSDGQYHFDIRDNAEGELSILKNEIYTLTVRLSEQAKQLKKDKEGLKDVLSDISHQLKTPLTSLSVMSELLEDEGLPPKKRQEFIEKQKRSLNNMKWMVLQLLKMAQLDAGTIHFNIEDISVRQLVDESIEAVQILFELKEQNLHFSPVPGTIPCDLPWTKEALTNLLKNASEHTPHGGTIRIGYDENPLMHRISVTDSGSGIDAKDIPHLFERFYKGKEQSGVGLGLALSRTILRGQGGDVDVTSIPGAGTTFTLKFYK